MDSRAIASLIQQERKQVRARAAYLYKLLKKSQKESINIKEVTSTRPLSKEISENRFVNEIEDYFFRGNPEYDDICLTGQPVVFHPMKEKNRWKKYDMYHDCFNEGRQKYLKTIPEEARVMNLLDLLTVEQLTEDVRVGWIIDEVKLQYVKKSIDARKFGIEDDNRKRTYFIDIQPENVTPMSHDLSPNISMDYDEALPHSY